MAISRILVVGSGGREHALAWRLARDAHAPRLIVTPGNDGMARALERLDVSDTDAAGIVRAARDARVDLVVVGPESALAAGVSDALVEAGTPCFGASRAAARLESSKWFAKEVMREAGVPTARAFACESETEAFAALETLGAPHVVKADGLAAGKGVLVTSDLAEARAFVRDCLGGGRFGAQARVVIEEFLVGEEASIIAICDGERHVLLPPARDHKRAFDGDAGPNTGGMGAVAPPTAVDAEVERITSEQVVTPMLRAMAARGTPYRGALYCGLMLKPVGTAASERVRVVEFNARFGDPETQVMLPLVEGDFAALLASAARGALEPRHIGRATGAAVTIALVDEGYPERALGTGTIEGLDALEGRDGLFVFHAGTRREGDGWRVKGGRAAYVTATGEDAATARERAYAACATLRGAHWRMRSDIGAGPGVPAATQHGMGGQ
ncbi:MAG: phosphoribosylamine--glycine ligase [Candidatus Eisenbacteria bacterium]|uniref:Phosphoribosylamine--glycine ligase n=1 Tax=Eiseniibacteriota bacterium TaxID=2212470 RepID=A0A933SB51_UNCEI|nr:phosphoribosylamine--glycine ligase [Candidatus Eisenbacteria bacterium]